MLPSSWQSLPQLVHFPYLVLNSVAGNVSRALLLKGFSSTFCSGPGAGLESLVLGEAAVRELAQAFRRIQHETGGDASALEDHLRAEIFSHAKLGPIARNIIKLWYVGSWYQLPFEWREAFGVREKDTTFVVSPAAYPEGLLWPAIGANPSGAKAPGYGTWSEPPVIGEL